MNQNWEGVVLIKNLNLKRFIFKATNHLTLRVLFIDQFLFYFLDWIIPVKYVKTNPVLCQTVVKEVYKPKGLTITLIVSL